MIAARDATAGHYTTIMTTIRAKAAARARDGSRTNPSGPTDAPGTYQGWLARLTAPHAHQLQALSRRITRQNAAIARFCAKHGISKGAGRAEIRC